MNRATPRWEYVGWAAAGTTVLVKGWEGCVTSTNFSFGYRRPPAEPRSYRFSLTIGAASQSIPGAAE